MNYINILNFIPKENQKLYSLLTIVFYLINLIFFVCGSLGYYKIAKQKKHKNPWFAFIPIVNIYLFKDIVKNITKKDSNLILTFWFYFISLILTKMFPLFLGAQIGFTIWFLVEYYKGLYMIYKEYLNKKYQILLFFLSIVFIEPFVILYIGFKQINDKTKILSK